MSYTGDPNKWRDGVAARKTEKHVLAKTMLVETSNYLLQLFFDTERLVKKPFETPMEDWGNELPEPRDQKLEREPTSEFSDFEVLLATAPVEPPVLEQDVLVNEYSENDEQTAFVERKRNYIPPYLRRTIMPLSQLPPMEVVVSPDVLLTSRATRSVRKPRERGQSVSSVKSCTRKTSRVAESDTDAVLSTNNHLRTPLVTLSQSHADLCSVHRLPLLTSARESENGQLAQIASNGGLTLSWRRKTRLISQNSR